MLRLRRFWKTQPASVVVAGMATMPSRLATLPNALQSISGQVDRLYLYLDGHAATPVAALGDEKIIPILSKTLPGLRANGKFLALVEEQSDYVFVGVDDDICYNAQYINKTVGALAKHGAHTVVGYHGIMLAQPLKRYREGRRVHHFQDELRYPLRVDILGTGTVAFSASRLSFDVRSWRHINSLDLCLALEAADRNMPLVCIERDAGFLRAIEENQADSCYVALTYDDSLETALAIDLLGKRGDRKWSLDRIIQRRSRSRRALQ